MMVSLLEDNSLGDTSLNPYLHILNNGEGIGQGRVNDDMGNVTIEHVDTSKISPDEFLLDKNIFTQDQDRLEIGIEAGDVNSLLEQFEESEVSQTDQANEVTHIPLNTNFSKKNADSDLKKSDMSIEAIAKKIAPVKRKSTILLENVTLPLKRNRKPLNHVAFKTTSSQPCSHPCSNPNSLPNSAPNSLPASLPSSCNSSRSCSPVHQWTVPSMDHDYCYTPNVYLPMNVTGSLSPKCVNKENGEISDLSTPEKKEEKRNELYMGKYKIKKRNHHRHHHHHHRHHRHSHQDVSKTILDAGFMMNSNSPSPALVGSVHRELDISQRAREEFQRRFGKLEVPVIPEKKTLKIQSLNEPPLMNLRKKVDNPNLRPALSNIKVQENFQPELVSSGKKKETYQKEESRSRSLITELCSDNESLIRIEQENKKTKPLSANEVHPTDFIEIRKPVKQERMPVYGVGGQEQLKPATTDNSQDKLIPAISARDQVTSVNEVNEARPVVPNLEENMETQQVDKTEEVCPKEDIYKAIESQYDITCEQKLQVSASVDFAESIDTNIGSCVDKINMNIDAVKHDNVTQLDGEINSLIKECGQKYDESDAGNAEYLAKCKEREVIPEEEDSGEIGSSDEVKNKDDDDMHRWRERSYSPYRRGRSSSRSSDRSSQWTHTSSQSFTKRKSRSLSYESLRSRSRSNSYRSRRGHHRRRQRYRRSSHSSCSMSSRSSSRGSRGSRRRRTRSSSCSTCPSRSYSRSRSRSFSRSHSRSRSRQSRCRSRSRSSRRRSGRRSSDRKRRYLRDRSVSRERRLEMKKRQEQEWEDRRVLYVGNISEGTTRRDISCRFSKFGDITRITLHFRDKGDNYCFVTFAYTCDAYAAVEFGNEDPSFPKYEICFGGRRNFCRTSYADLDNMHREEEELKYGYNGSVEPTRTRSSSKETDFDALLKQALKKIKHR
ncbi:uncharacterized protein LOC117111011 [Anneissia japonica]|uniref:uncharacterized protein LOC117111011 n=1 Tax=Anneissia japonica TaxID=1529436 RepID=UPI001425A5CC|nr:uncharacterized protein LOC117111011 [Anneissia japonica]